MSYSRVVFLKFMDTYLRLEEIEANWT